MAKKKRKLSFSGIVLLVGIIVILIPVIALGVILIQAQRGSDTPILGNRFENELKYEITDDMLTSLESELSSVEHAEKTTVVLKVATLRVYIDAEDDLSDQEIEDIAMDVYDKVDSVIPVDTYFTEVDGAKEYDLEIHVYNNTELPEGEFIYKILTKNAAMTTFIIDTTSTARNQELADELTAEEVTTVIEGEETENTESTEDGETAGE